MEQVPPAVADGYVRSPSNNGHKMPKRAYEAFSKFIDNYMIIPKLIYIILMLQVAVSLCFRADMLIKHYKMSASEYGLMSGIVSVLVFFVSSYSVYIADRYNKHKIFMILSAVMNPLIYQLLRIKFPLGYFIYFIAPIWTAFNVFFIAYWFMLDGNVVRKLVSIPGVGKECYGRQRLWGTVATAFGGFLIGACIKEFGTEAIFTGVMICGVLNLFLICIYFPNDSSSSFKKDCTDIEISIKSQNSKAKTAPLKELLTNSEFMFFLLVVFIAGISRTVFSFYHIYYLEHEFGLHDKAKAGLTAFPSAGVEIISFFIAKPIILKYISIYWIVAISLLTNAIRSWCYVWVPADPSYFIHLMFAETLKGIFVGFMQIAGVQLCNTIVPKGLETTAQSLYMGVFQGVSTLVGALLGGFLYKKNDASDVWLVTAWLSTVGVILYLFEGFLGEILRRRKHKTIAVQSELTVLKK